ncbi:transcription factor GTE4-like isoform X1 [Rhodamnia argentea]|uniref:Transcription factor GTE4-like isoform X1 n=1 Tax=Rhodamnia argentea TaxID=178133 RepID=A0A8B8QUY9_9MYRT|nr:transcription factor GTE4-like isoform X1 [Rhodamnia argentea]XP_030550173.1 transcription factor GTE4-like isoform X1 [Rhodamnia argentea]
MASELIGDEDSREKQPKRADGSKVYSRKRLGTQSSLTPVVTTEYKNSLIPQAGSQSEDAVASDDSSSQSLERASLSKVRELAKGSSTPGYALFGRSVRISVDSRSKFEIRELKRKLMRELDQVKNLLKRLESKEIQVNGYSASDAVGKAGTLVRVNSEVGSVGVPVPQPFQGHGVSMADSNNGVGREILGKDRRNPKVNQLHPHSESVAHKDKFRPQESNKKMKKSNRTIDDRGPSFGLDKHSSQLYKSCDSLLSRLMKHKYGWVFNTPVDPKKLGLHDYFTIIKHPMDLGTVKSRLNKNWYKSPREFAEDVRLTFHNAMIYNPKGQDVHFMAETMLKLFEDSWKVIEKENNLDHRYDVSLPTHISKKAPTPALIAPPASSVHSDAENLDKSESRPLPVDSRTKPAIPGHPGKKPVPKNPEAQDSHKRDMTYEEKQRLSEDLQTLPSEKLEDVVQIIKKRNPHLFQQEDEIEVDIDSVDSHTLWELDNFVNNHKKSLTKNSRKAEVPLESCTEDGNAVAEMNEVIVVGEAPTENAEGPAEENAVVHSPPLLEKLGANVSESSSSSGSSSDSGSSSTDSDSDRSSL